MNIKLLNKLPSNDQITQVYALIVTILFSWAIVKTIQDVTTRWMLFFDLYEILSLFAYILSAAFVESTLLLLVFVMIGVLLPRSWFLDKFVTRASILTIGFLGSIMYIYTQTLTDALLLYIKEWAIFFVFSTSVLALLVELNQTFRKVVETIVDRCTVFLYVYIPISILSMILIIIRNVA